MVCIVDIKHIIGLLILGLICLIIGLNTQSILRLMFVSIFGIFTIAAISSGLYIATNRSHRAVPLESTIRDI